VRTLRPALIAVAAILLVSCAWTSATGATRQVKLDASSLLALGTELEVLGSPSEAEQVYRALAKDPDKNVRAEARFRLAKLLATAGQKAEAARLLRLVVDEHPDSTRPRLELVGLLQQLGHEASALRELRALSALDLPPDLARYVDRLGLALRASQPLSFQIAVAAAPDTNINRATRARTLSTIFGDFTFNDESKARSGMGAAIRTYAQGRLPLDKTISIRARASLDANLYRHSRFNDVSLDFAAGPEFLLGAIRVSAEAGVAQQWYGMHPFQRNLRLSPSARIVVDRTSQVRVEGSARWSSNQLNELQSGRGLSLSLRYDRALSSQLAVTLGAGLDRFKARDDAYSTRSWSVNGTVYRDIGRMTLEVGAEAGELCADERLAILPEARSDKLTRFHFGAAFRQLSGAGFVPTLSIVNERNRSSVEFYDYSRTRTEFGVSRAF
jgi:outer membrane protein